MRIPFFSSSSSSSSAPPAITPGDGDKSPFRARGDGRRAVLCLHGFTGTPFEVRPVAEALAAKGYDVAAPLLAGHGTTADALRATRWTDWLASAMSAFDELRAACGGRPVAIAGFSMGGLLALRICAERPADVAAVALMGVPLRLKGWQAAGVRVVNGVPGLLRRGPLRDLPKRRGYDVTDEDMRRRNPALPVLPIEGVGSLLDLSAVVRDALPDIKTPALVVHGALDRTVPLDDSLELVGCLGGDRLERLWLQKSGHLVAIDVERTQLIAAIDTFFTAQLEVPPRTEAAS